MKQRNGFVSNSSSSSFIVLMGQNFNPTDEEIQNAIFLAGDEKYVSIDDVRKDIELLKTHYVVYDYDSKASYSIAALCDSLDIVVGKIDGGPGDGKITNILTEKNLPKFKKAIEE